MNVINATECALKMVKMANFNKNNITEIMLFSSQCMSSRDYLTGIANLDHLVNVISPGPYSVMLLSSLYWVINSSEEILPKKMTIIITARVTTSSTSSLQTSNSWDLGVL